jgi:hypothetical protein
METAIRNVGELDSRDRQALEHSLGQTLRANQKQVIRIVNLQVQPDVAAVITKPNRNGGAAAPGIVTNSASRPLIRRWRTRPPGLPT